jgi:SNF family Na+-dependent transporter|tara:strand:+ start:12427 stop:14091 length:1665 start_codon:yes stop_codon:yes gene_type:complete
MSNPSPMNAMRSLTRQRSMGTAGGDKWSSNNEFILAAVGSAVGLGNIMRFPSKAYTYGGGTFIWPWLLATVFLGWPLLCTEMAMGQQLQEGIYGCMMKADSRARGIAYVAMAGTFMLTLYYAVIAAWAWIYFFLCFEKTFQWEKVGANEYFLKDVIEFSGSINTTGSIAWKVALALLLQRALVIACMWNGTKTIGAVSKILTPIPFVVIFITLIYGATLPGAGNGLTEYFTPDWAQLGKSDVWIDAIGQLFFGLSVAMGVMQSYGSDLNKKAPIVYNATVVTAANAFASFTCGFPIFMFIGFLAHKRDVPVSEISSGGFGLVFTTIPTVLAYMPSGASNVMGLLFFLMIATLGLSSSISLLQAIITFLGDLYPELMEKRRREILVGFVAFQYLIGLLFVCEAGYAFIDIVDTFLANYQTILTGIAETLVICYVLRGGVERIFSQVAANSETDPRWTKLHPFFVASMKYTIPAVLTWMIMDNIVKDASGKGIADNYPTWGIVVFGYVLIIGVVTVAPIAYALCVPIDNGDFEDDDDEIKQVGKLPAVQGEPATTA